MGTHEIRNLCAIFLCLLIGSLIAWAGSENSLIAFGVPLFALCGAFAFLVNWIGFVPAYLYQTERYYDLIGSLTYLSLVTSVFVLRESHDLRSSLISALVAVWAIRLGGFLFRRVLADGSDGRFDSIKPDFLWFLMAWTLQALWVFLTLSCGLAAMTSAHQPAFGWVGAVGLGLWILGFTIECLADSQKRRFRRDPSQQGRFISTGIWAWSRHPNYFGEIMLWAGIAIIALPALSGWQYATLVSPVFVFLLLTRVSGVPLLEARAEKRWGEEEAYKAYKDRTPVLVPRPPSMQ